MVRLKYIDGDPLVLVKLINPRSKAEQEVYAYTDTGSDSLAVPRDVWLELNIGYENRAAISTVGGAVNTWYSFLDVLFLGEIHKDVMVFYMEEGDVLIGRCIIDNYRLTFDGPRGVLEIQ